MSEKWQGEGWYTFEQWNTETESFAWPESMNEAEWVEDKWDFAEYSTVPDGFESIVTYYGDGDIPTDGMKVAERFVATFTPEQMAAYEKSREE